MKEIKSASLITAIKTPFNVKGDIDFNTYDQLVAEQIKAGVDGIVVGGTTGEGHLLTWEEHLILIAHSVHKHGKDLLIIGNTGSNNTREAIKATQYGFAAGMAPRRLALAAARRPPAVDTFLDARRGRSVP